MSIEVHNFLNDSGGNFTETAPRPPVPGEENELQSNGGTSTRSSGSHKSHISTKSHSSGKSHKSENSPAATPRRSNLDKSYNPLTNRSNPKLDGEDANAPLGFEPEGSAASSPPFTEDSTPQYLKWAQDLHLLLEDRDGVKLFKEFLDQEHCSNTLDFLFACRGLKMQHPGSGDIVTIVKAIYKKFVKCNQLHFKPETRRSIIERINRKEFSQSIYDVAQKEVEDVMQSETYPSFLKSDLYVQYIQAGGDSPKTSNNSSGSNSVRPVSGPLPTLQEDSILKNEDILSDDSMNQSRSATTLTLTPQSLMYTLNTRSIPVYHRKEGIFLQPSTHPNGGKLANPYHVSYAPTSAQDSELASLSSDALTDDTKSQTDSSIDGRDAYYPGSKRWVKKPRIRRMVEQNLHTNLEESIVPRTRDKAPKDHNLAETDPDKFAAELIERLKKVLADCETKERVNESLSAIEKDDSTIMPPPSSMPPLPPKTIINTSLNTSSMNNTSMNSMQLSQLMASVIADAEEGNAQDILEQHCSRIWEGSNDQTPSRSPPGGHRSPDRASFRGLIAGPTPNTSGVSLYGRGYPHGVPHKRKDKDTFTTSSGSNILSMSLSQDSGMSEDRSGNYRTDYRHMHQHHHHHHVTSGGGGGVAGGKDGRSIKSADMDTQRRHLMYYRSDPNMQARGHSEPLPGDAVDSHARGRSRDGRPARNSAKKTSDSSSNFDSGVSLMYDPKNDPSKEKVLAWMNQNDRMSHTGGGSTQYSTDGSDRGSSQKQRSSHNKSVSSSASPAPHRSRKLAGYVGGRSGSMDRSADFTMAHVNPAQPRQPIMQDSSMPLLNPPNPTTQLEEAKRLLQLEEESKQRLLSKSKSFDGRSSKDRRIMAPPSHYPPPPLPPRSLPISKSIPHSVSSAASGLHEVSSSEESSKSFDSKKTAGVVGGRKPSSSAPVTPAQETTTVVSFFCDEPIPYRTTLPGKQITLAMFKNHVLNAKKSNYRYFFKMTCEDFDPGVILEEVTEDDALLPFFEGKVVAKVQKIE